MRKGLRLVTTRGTALFEILDEYTTSSGVKMFSYTCEGASGVATETSLRNILYNELESRPTLRVVGI